MPQTDTANVIPELAGGWNDGLAYDFFRFLKRPLNQRLQECIDFLLANLPSTGKVVFDTKFKMLSENYITWQ